MTARPTITIGVQPGTKLLRVERVERDKRGDAPNPFVDAAERAILASLDTRGLAKPTTQRMLRGAWMLWINANVDMTRGTHILLHDNGKAERVTVHNDGTEDVFVIKEGDR